MKTLVALMASLCLVFASTANSGMLSDENTQVTAPASVQPSEDRYIVKDDPGGSVDDFEAAIQYFKDNNMKIKVDGDCVSACTLLLNKKINLDICVTSNAKFGFHHPFLSNGFSISYTVPAVALADKYWKTHFVDVYYDWVNLLIERNHGVPNVYTGAQTSDVFWIGIDELSKYMPVCNS